MECHWYKYSSWIITMAKINFPPNPAVEDTFTDSGTGQLFVYNGEGWVRTKQGSGIPEPLGEGVQYARIVDTQGLPGRWEKVATDVWYLGAFDAHPYFDHEGNAVVKGHVYFNTVEEINYSYAETEWFPFADINYVFGLLSYVYISTAGQTVFSGADNYGLIPTGWIEGETIVNILVNGEAQVEYRGVGVGAVEIGVYTINYTTAEITFLAGLTLDDEVELITYQSVPGDDASVYEFVSADPELLPGTDTKVPTQKAVIEYVTNHAIRDNLVINPEFVVNQRGFTGYWESGVGANEYGFDMWRRDGAFGYYIRQDIDHLNLRRGKTYTLSFRPAEMGEQTGSVSDKTYTLASGISPLIFQYPAGSSRGLTITVPADVYDVKLEQNKIPSFYQVPDLATEITRCYRTYYEYARDVLVHPIYNSTSALHRENYLEFPVTMLKTPILTYTAHNFIVGQPEINELTASGMGVSGQAISGTGRTYLKNLILNAQA